MQRLCFLSRPLPAPARQLGIWVAAGMLLLGLTVGAATTPVELILVAGLGVLVATGLFAFVAKTK
ncbi:MAG: hypothetical protein AAGF12_10430 [Myxococcota bacterium]